MKEMTWGDPENTKGDDGGVGGGMRTQGVRRQTRRQLAQELRVDVTLMEDSRIEMRNGI